MFTLLHANQAHELAVGMQRAIQHREDLEWTQVILAKFIGAGVILGIDSGYHSLLFKGIEVVGVIVGQYLSAGIKILRIDIVYSPAQHYIVRGPLPDTDAAGMYGLSTGLTDQFQTLL